MDTLLIVFIHGFLGRSTNFFTFPDSLRRELSKTHSKVKTIVYPTYDTIGDLSDAVVYFNRWLKERVNERKQDGGSVKAALCGHSMGGLLMADALLRLQGERKGNAQLFPQIIACIAFDTPVSWFCGVSWQFLIRTSVLRYREASFHVAFCANSVGCPRTLYKVSEAHMAELLDDMLGVDRKAGTIAKVGGLGRILGRICYALDIFDPAQREKRNEGMIKMEKEHGLIFRVFYQTGPVRTFIEVPSRHENHWKPAPNDMPNNVILGHLTMFHEAFNDNRPKLLQETVEVIKTAVRRNA
ncbi:hypothetical protein BDN72DRAFT_877367 [Pluteus cervinus]|uniref:Uncharacterized protein n=1 Tax=Pluteus cervinus TaxID=181527 RepID=A0ACD3AZP4_9AGAR|nr:hypothetical protein BDN72DRAFT_877367 [Pluteus cervinus]